MNETRMSCHYSYICSDFVQCLPYDAVATIFSLCSFRDCISFTRVSTTWRAFLLGWPDLWEDLSDPKCDYSWLLSLRSPSVQGRFVHRVDMQDKDMDEQASVLEHLVDMECSALDYLRFSCNTATIHNMKALVDLAGSSLKRVDVKIIGDPRYIRALAFILKRCQSQLTHLRFQHLHAIRPLSTRLDGLALPQYSLQNITHTSLACTMDMSYLQRLVGLLVNVRSFRIDEDMIVNQEYPCQVLALLSLSLPSCQKLHICGGSDGGTSTNGTLQRIALLPVTPDSHSNTAGLRHVILRNLHTAVRSSIFATMLQRHYLTLESVIVIGCRGTITFPPLAFPNLRDIRLDHHIRINVDLVLARDLLTMLQLSSSIKSVHINCQAPFDEILSGLEGKQVLRTLVLRDSTHRGTLVRMPQAGWGQLRRISLYGASRTNNNMVNLNHNAAWTNWANAISASPCLEIVDVEVALVAAPGALQAIGYLRNLQYLRVQKAGPYVLNRNASAISTDSIIAMLQGPCRRSLRKLCLLDIMSITDDVLDAIANNLSNGLTHLQLGFPDVRVFTILQRQVVFNTAMSVTPASIRRLADEFAGKQLQYLGLRHMCWPQSSCTGEERKVLEETRKHVEDVLASTGTTVTWDHNHRCRGYAQAFGGNTG
ncbi:hypothetical protein BJV82DRAFT_622883 [Fennellomyces sp. T-0311]|nr:hypothetical protein BJV82DRAFT_622883 [Fennellomyces sp. T-0311]